MIRSLFMGVMGGLFWEWNGVVAVWAEGVAFEESPKSEQEAFEGPVELECLDHIGGAGGYEAAGSVAVFEGDGKDLVGLDGGYHQAHGEGVFGGGAHFLGVRIPALRQSRRRSWATSVAGLPRMDLRATRMQSVPGWRRCWLRRTASRIRRLARLLQTASWRVRLEVATPNLGLPAAGFFLMQRTMVRPG